MAGESEVTERPRDVELSDDFLSKYMGEEADDEAAEGEPEDSLSDETDDEDEETGDDQETDSEEGGTEDEGDEDEFEDEDGNEEDEDESDGTTDEDEDSETDLDEDETFLDKKTLQKHQAEINKNPHLKAVYRSMQADYTRKTQRLAAVQGEFEQGLGEFEEFDHLLRDVSEGGGREMFLIDAALDNPQAFQRAFDRAVELQEDPEAKKKYERERTIEQKSRELTAREKRDQATQAQARVTEVQNLTSELAAEYGITDAARLGLVKQAVANVIHANRQAGRHKDVFITDEQVEQAVAAAARALRVTRQAKAKEARSARQAKQQQNAKKAAKSAKKRVVPKGKRAPAPAGVGKLPKDGSPEDRLDARLNQLLG